MQMLSKQQQQQQQQQQRATLFSLGKPGSDFLERGGDVLLVEWQHRPVVDVQLDEVLLREIQEKHEMCMYECMYGCIYDVHERV